MNTTLIRTTGQFPPGAWEYHDPITSIRYKDTHTTFDERVRQVINDRLANRRLFTDEARVDPGSVAKEIGDYTCRRLNGDKRYCAGTAEPLKSIAIATAGLFSRSCPKCGSKDLRPTYCKTCSSLKLTGYECGACMEKLPK